METQAPASKALHPLVWVAGIALILFSAVGVGAFLGWIPSSIGGPGEEAALESRAAAVRAPKAPTQTAARPARAVEHPAPAPVPRQAPRPDPVASNTCADCGVIESVREIESKGTGSGLGAVGGAVVGALVGNQVGGGKGKDVMTVVGAVGGGLAGNEVEKRVKSTKSYSTTVRLHDGTSRVFSDAAAPGWNVGDKVRIVNGAIRSNA